MYIGFASDNYAGINPEMLSAIAHNATGFAGAYGDDSVTDTLREQLGNLFSDDYNFFPCLTGTGANITALTSLTSRLGAVICPASAHILISESTALHAVADLAVRSAPTIDGKLRPADIEQLLWGRGDPHKAQSQVVSISQPTECGTVYSLSELDDLISCAHSHGLYVHLDGCRLPLAADFLGCSLAQTSTDLGVDTILLGGTKMGAMIGELLIAKKELDILGYLKLNSQLFSKLRYVSAQLLALYGCTPWDEPQVAGTDRLYHINARNANFCAQELLKKLHLAQLPDFSIAYPVESNAIFARIPARVRSVLAQKYLFYDWEDGCVRWMTNFATTLADIDHFVTDILAAYQQDS